MKTVFSFPDEVDEISARLVATGAALLGSAFVVTGWVPLVVILAAGFVARVLSGPTLSPLGQFVTRVVRPRLSVAPRPTAGAPKRFAQGIGATLSSAAALTAVLGNVPVARGLIAALVVAASLEAGLGFCLGCKIYAQLIRIGVFPETACADCADLSGRLRPVDAHALPL